MLDPSMFLRTDSALSRVSAPEKKPRARLDQVKSGIFCAVYHSRSAAFDGPETLRQPSQGASFSSARLKFGLEATKPCSPFEAA